MAIAPADMYRARVFFAENTVVHIFPINALFSLKTSFYLDILENTYRGIVLCDE